MGELKQTGSPHFCNDFLKRVLFCSMRSARDSARSLSTGCSQRVGFPYSGCQSKFSLFWDGSCRRKSGTSYKACTDFVYLVSTSEPSVDITGWRPRDVKGGFKAAPCHEKSLFVFPGCRHPIR